MAKVTSAERVSPITRANYAGNAGNVEHGDEYDPLAALANLVGSVESGAAVSTVANEPVAQEQVFDLESELVKDFQNAENYSPQPQSDLIDLENELAYALDAGVPAAINPEHQPQEFVDAQLPATEEAAYTEPVLQSLASLHTAFGVAPQANTDPVLPVQSAHEQPVDALSREAAIENQLLAELGIEPQPQSTISQSTIVNVTNDAVPDNVATGVTYAEGNVTIPPTATAAQFLQSEPFAEVSPILNPPETVSAGIDNLTNTPIDDGFASEFEAAISGNAEGFIAEQPAAQTPVYGQPGVSQVNDSFQDDMPFGTLEDAVTMPPVNTPFDHQVDHALSDIIDNEAQTDSQIDWSGNLAEELQGIVSSTSPLPAAAAGVPVVPLAETPGLAAANELEAGEYRAADTTSFVDDPVNSYPVVDTSIPESTDFSAFEQELADQLNPDFNDDPHVAIPETPELLEAQAKKRGGMGVAVGVLGVAVVVAAGAFSWNYFSNDQVPSSVPTLLASSGPVKIRPKEPGGVQIPNQDQVVFEQVNGNGTDTTSQERLASGTEAPIRVVTADATPPVVQPLPITNSSSSAAKSSERITASDTILVRTEQAIISPRKVRTVIVRPDGTIVAAKPGASIRKVKSIKVASTTKIENFVEPIAKSTTGSMVNSTPPVVMALPTDTASGATRSAVPAGKIKILSVKPVANGSAALRTNTRAIVKSEPVAIAAPRKVKVQPIKVITPVKKAKPASNPVKLASTTAGGYVMQISSQRSAEAAQTSYNRLSRKFAGVLGGKGVDIRRFKLKDKGIYYRVRIPAGSKKSAINLCTRYKSAGGSCFVTR